VSTLIVKQSFTHFVEIIVNKTLANVIKIPIMRIHGNGKDASQSGYPERKRLSF